MGTTIRDQDSLPHGLPRIHRFITDHDDAGQAVFSTTIPEQLVWDDVGHIAKFSLGYTTSHFPVSLDDQKDIAAYQRSLVNKPGIVLPGGTVLRIVDIAPGEVSPMHRTVSLDYGIVLEGEVELELDSGEKRVLRRGDLAIQRGTNHAWRNLSGNTWARMLYVLQESLPLTVQGKTLSEDYGSGMPGVKASRS